MADIRGEKSSVSFFLWQTADFRLVDMVGFQAPAAKRDRKASLFGPLYSHVQSNFLFQAPHIIENRIVCAFL